MRSRRSKPGSLEQVLLLKRKGGKISNGEVGGGICLLHNFLGPSLCIVFVMLSVFSSKGKGFW